MSFAEYLAVKLQSWSGELPSDGEDLRREVMDDVANGLAGIEPDVQSFVKGVLSAIVEDPKTVFAAMRKIQPILLLPGLAIVARFKDVCEVLQQDAYFHVRYAEKMGKVTDGDNFFLGMENTPRYEQDVSNMRIVVRREDIPERIAGFVEKNANELVAHSGGRLDVVQDLGRVVACRWIADYFGLPVTDVRAYGEDLTLMFRYLFVPQNPPEVDVAALATAARHRQHIDTAIAARKKERGKRDDVIERCLALQDANVPGTDDRAIRNNLIGLIIGAVNTTATVVAKSLDQLLRRPEALAGAQVAALADDDQLVANYVFEALRFSPMGAGIFRVTSEDYVLAKGETRAALIPSGATVLASTQSAMMDELELDAPEEFRVDRPEYQNLHFGHGMHTCFGQHINRVQIPRIAKSLLKCQNLRRAAGDDGHLDNGGGPFPVRMVLEFDPPA